MSSYMMPLFSFLSFINNPSLPPPPKTNFYGAHFGILSWADRCQQATAPGRSSPSCLIRQGRVGGCAAAKRWRNHGVILPSLHGQRKGFIVRRGEGMSATVPFYSWMDRFGYFLPSPYQSAPGRHSLRRWKTLA